MGLDITAYSRLQLIGKHTEGWCEEEDHIEAYAYTCFPDSFRGIVAADNDGQFLNGGCYAPTEDTKTHGFRAGSYSGYNRWRDDLRAQFNPDTDPDKPFYELIYFADNEGTIGPEAAADLLADFRAHADQYAPSGDPEFHEYHRGVYDHWTRAFELAAEGGLVAFH